MIENFNYHVSAKKIMKLFPLRAFCFRGLIVLLFFLYSPFLFAEITKDTLNNDSSILNLKINLDIHTASLKTVLEDLSSKYNIGFLYIEEQIPLESKINNVKGEFKLKEFLDLILKGTNLSYFLLEDQIGLTTKEFSDSIEVDSNKRAIVFPSSQATHVDLKKYKKITVKSIKNKNLRKKVKRVYYLRKKISIRPISGNQDGSLNPVIHDTIPPLSDNDNGKLKSDIRNKFFKYKDNPQSFFIFRITPGMSFWKMEVNNSSKVDDINRNQYAQFNSNISIDLLFEFNLYKNIMIRSGVGYFTLNKNGTFTTIKTNSYYPYISIVEKSNYSYKYSYFSIPLGAAYKFGNNKSFIVLAGEVKANFFLHSDMTYYPIYKTQYFYDLNPLGTGQEPYYTNSNETINKEKAAFRSMIFSFSLKAENNFRITKKSIVFFAPEITTLLGSIYKKNAPIKENPFVLGVSLGYRYFF
jgi:hypothetical protein